MSNVEILINDYDIKKIAEYLFFNNIKPNGWKEEIEKYKKEYYKEDTSE